MFRLSFIFVLAVLGSEAASKANPFQQDLSQNLSNPVLSNANLNNLKSSSNSVLKNDKSTALPNAKVINVINTSQIIKNDVNQNKINSRTFDNLEKALNNLSELEANSKDRNLIFFIRAINFMRYTINYFQEQFNCLKENTDEPKTNEVVEEVLNDQKQQNKIEQKPNQNNFQKEQMNVSIGIVEANSTKESILSNVQQPQKQQQPQQPQQQPQKNEQNQQQKQSQILNEQNPMNVTTENHLTVRQNQQSMTSKIVEVAKDNVSSTKKPSIFGSFFGF